MKNHYWNTAIALCLTVSLSGVAQAQSTQKTSSQPPTLLTISPQAGSGLAGEAQTVEVWAGRGTAIDFSRVKEQIKQVFLADPSRFTYTTDTELTQGKATTLFLRQIVPLKFPHLTTTPITNLFVKTQTPSGAERLYTFNLQAGKSTPRYSGLSVATIERVVEGNKSTLDVGASRPATIDDIEQGLQVAINRQYTPTSDPIVYKVREFLSEARNTSNWSWSELAKTNNIPLPVLNELASLGIETSGLEKPSSQPTKVIEPNQFKFVQ